MVTNQQFDSQAGPDPACLEKAEAGARDAYSAPGRFYHDRRHLDHCLGLVDGSGSLGERDRRLLRWAILWHDAIYEPGLRDNEERSARLALSELSRCGVAANDSEEVARLVRLTQSHRPDPDDRLGALMVSIDLSILGSEPERYADYAADVRREYAHVPEPLWRTGRALVLKRLLASDPLFPDPGFRALFESQARLNMEAELKRLGEG